MTDKYPFYITTPIYYVNDNPHIGSAYTSIIADILARYMRLYGHPVRFLTGTDEYGQKVHKAAHHQNLNPQNFVDELSKKFQVLTPLLHLSNDDFIRTTESRHHTAAQALWTRMLDNGFIYQAKYAGWYCVRDEAYYQESELVDGKAPTGADVEWIEESSYFFALSKFQQPLLDYYQAHPDFIAPSSRLNEVKSFVESGLKDLSISRTTFNWGVPVPNDPGHVMYVWVDALTNYLTTLGFPGDMENVHKWFSQAIHMIGKDITRFHAVYWPAFLMAAGLPLPRRIYAHGWWTNEGVKISKSLGNVINPHQVVDEFGVDALRYFLIAEKPCGVDGDFSRDGLINRLNTDLANSLGNLVQRVLSFIQKHAGGIIPKPDQLLEPDLELIQLAQQLVGKVYEHVQNQDLFKLRTDIWQVVASANRYVDAQAPWILKKTDVKRMNTVLYVLVDVIRHLAVLIAPIMPMAGQKMMDFLNLTADQRSISSLENSIRVNQLLPEPSIIFLKIQ